MPRTIPFEDENEVLTPIKVDRLAFWLEGYDVEKKSFLLEGFSNGFQVGFVGKTNNDIPKNLKSATQFPNLVSKHIDKEIEAGRVIGPFDEPPFSQFQCSPVGLVEKKEKGSYRMIHHLSYPEGSSVNDQIDPEWSSVSYANIGDAIDLVINLCPKTFMAKTDVKSAFRTIPLHPSTRHLFVFHWEGKYYVDRCLQMGCSSSCQIFESLSTAVEWIAKSKLNIQMVHILDDFFIASVSQQVGSFQLQQFLNVCKDIGLPMAPEKTFWPSNVMSFVGFEIDTINQEVRLPLEKIQKCTEEITCLLQKNRATLKELQSIIGLLNFACAVILPGRPFLRRLIDLTVGLRAPHHRRRLTSGTKSDLSMWLTFLSDFNGKSLFVDSHLTADYEIHLFTDASGSIGYGAILGNQWFNGKWSTWWTSQNIMLLELYPILLAVQVWGCELQNKRLLIHTDNESLVPVLTKHTSKHPIIMILVRKLVLLCLKINLVLTAEHIAGKENNIADALSRFQMERFRALAPKAERLPCPIPALPKRL